MYMREGVVYRTVERGCSELYCVECVVYSTVERGCIVL